MPDDPKHIRDFRALARSAVTVEDVRHLEDELYGQNDRARAVLMVSFVENALRDFLSRRLRPNFPKKEYQKLFGRMAPLSSFSAKILTGFAFNYYGQDTYNDLDLIRELRNGFAHSRNSFAFDTAEVAAMCANLRTPDSPGSFIPAGYLMRALPAELDAASDNRRPRTRFLNTCYTLLDRLLNDRLDLP
jgi:hypothetical protein